MTTSTDDTQARKRLVTFITTYRDMLRVNPKASPTAIAKLIGCDVGNGAQLASIGIVGEEPDGSRTWLSKDTPDEIADKVIVYRRSLVPPSAAETIEALKKEVAALTARVAELEARPVSTKLSEDDAELLRLAVNDDAGQSARIFQLETVVGNLLRQIAAGAAMSPPAPTGQTKAKRVGIIGVFARDLTHLTTKGVDLTIIDHTSNQFSVPRGFDAVIVTDNGQKKWPEARAAYPLSCYRVSGGNRSIVGQLELIAKGGS